MTDCPLCKLAEGDIKTKLYYQNDDYIIVDCLTCKTPMLVAKRHDYTPSPGERGRLLELCKKLFGDKASFRGYMRSLPQHWHEHIMLK